MLRGEGGERGGEGGEKKEEGEGKRNGGEEIGAKSQSNHHRHIYSEILPWDLK